MKAKRHISSSLLSFCLMIFVGFLLAPSDLPAQGLGSWWGSTSWFDWSDFRAAGGVRLFLARLDSGKILLGADEFDLKDDYGIQDDPEPFVEIWGTIYLDRLGFRFAMEDNFVFRGRGLDEDAFSVSELDVRTARLGVDIDLIRYPFLRAGINFDYHTKPVKFFDRFNPRTRQVRPVLQLYHGDQPITMGIHGVAIPGRVREIPIIIQSRFRLRIPFLNRRNDARIYDFEISGGLRPSVWETSLYGYTTFATSVEAGFRWQRLDLSMDAEPTVKIRARWQGAFLQLGIAF